MNAIMIVLFVSFSVFNMSMVIAESNYDLFRRALSKSPTGTLDITVVNEKGIPVKDVFAKAWFGNPSKDVRDDGETDENGHIVLKGRSQSYANYSLKKKGYYSSKGMHRFTSETFDCVKETFWGYEWIPPYKGTVVLKTIRNPIPMYACRIDAYGYTIPKFDQEIPFDLQKMDWCKPYGKGIRDDVYIQLPTILSDFDAYETPPVLTLRFKYPDEGVYFANSNMQSFFKSDYHIDLKQSFQGAVNLGMNEKGGDQFGLHTQHSVFRIRCKHDENGNVISAHYGKIYGSWLATSRRQLGNVSIYFNPTQNDTNLEYDTKQNLYKGTTYEERLREKVLMP